MGFKKQTNSRVIGLDLSTNAIAFSLFVDGKLVYWGKLNMTGPAHLRNMQANRYARWMKDFLQPDLIVYESAVYIQNKKTVIALAYAFGAVVSSLTGPDTEVKQLTPTEWQAAIGNGPLTKAEKLEIRKATPDKSEVWYKDAGRQFRKQRTRKWVEKTYGIDIDDDDVTDAISIGHVGMK